MTATDPPYQHPAFPPPDDPEAMIWRYMDVPKFIDLVTNRRLYMARADLLGDDHEGTTPTAELEHWRQIAEDAKTDDERRSIDVCELMVSPLQQSSLQGIPMRRGVRRFWPRGQSLS